MSSYRNKPDRLEGVAQTRLLDALGSCRQAVISAQTQVKVAGPVYHGCQMVTAAIDAFRAMGIRDRPTAPRSPWQNGYAERRIGSIRRECLDHVIVFGERFAS